ncbi:MAG: hybrid sensor histidine kinase/response regulator [Cyanobacteria bacterium DS2.3.42]|nr:hybrid sensor histidine kinase/response regulator [Cyanobacteria bacterium DS2.3.42]
MSDLGKLSAGQMQSIFASLVESSEDAIISKNLQSIVQLWNHGAERIFGYTAAEMIGQSITTIIPDDLLSEEDVILDKLKRGERIEHYETIRKRKDGQLINISLTISPIYDETGTLVGGAKICRDVTGQNKETRERAMLAAIVETSEDGIISKDLNGIIQTWNKAATKIFGYTAEEVIGKSITILVPPEMPDEEPQLLAKLRKGEPIQHYETIRLRKDGQRIDVALTVSPIRDASGAIIGASKIVRDITKNKQLKQKYDVLQNTLLGVEETSRLKSSFISTLSHEIRAPLGGIISLAEILATEEEMPKSAKSVAEAVLEASRSLYKVLNELLDFTKVEAGKVHLENRMFSLRSTIIEVIRIINPVCSKKGLVLRSIVDPDIPDLISGDELRVRQVLLNLASNAVKFSKEGAIYISANMMETDDDSLRIEFKVTDSGIGLSEDTIGRLFQPFVQADTSTSRVFGGTGLGLSIAKSYVELMGGEIGVQSKPNEGSTFWFRIPFANVCDIRTDQEVEEASATASKESDADQ